LLRLLQSKCWSGSFMNSGVRSKMGPEE
jgi:hypothetical protein